MSRNPKPYNQSFIPYVEYSDDITKGLFNHSIIPNINKEDSGEGTSVGKDHAHTNKSNKTNELLLRVQGTLDFGLTPGAVVEPDEAIWQNSEIFPSTGFSQENYFGITIPDRYDGVKLGITRSFVFQGCGGEVTVMGPTYASILYPEYKGKENDVYQYVIPVPNDPSKVLAAPYGNARILWSRKPEKATEPCSQFTTDGYINIGDACWWQFFKLEEELCPCSSAKAHICDECGNDITGIDDCLYKRDVWLPKTFCGGSDSDSNPETDPGSGTSTGSDSGSGSGSGSVSAPEEEEKKECDSVPCIPKDSIVFAIWFTCYNKWIAVHWQKPPCPDFDKCTPKEKNIVRTYKPVDISPILDVEGDPCEKDSSKRGTCKYVFKFEVSEYFNDDCNDNLCLIEQKTHTVDVPVPEYVGYVPVICQVVDITGEHNCFDPTDTGTTYHLGIGEVPNCILAKYSIEYISDHLDELCPDGVWTKCDKLGKGDLPCSGGRQIQIDYPEVRVICGKVCATGKVKSSTCDISLNQDTTLEQHGTPDFNVIPSTDECKCGKLRIIPKTREAHIECDEWCTTNWKNGNPIDVPLVAQDGGEFTYLGSISVANGDECGEFSFTPSYERRTLVCGAICEPENASYTGEPINVKLWDRLVLTGGEDQTVLTGIPAGNIPVTLGGFETTNINFNGDATSATVTLNAPTSKPVSLTGNITGASVTLGGNTASNVTLTGTPQGTVSLTPEATTISLTGVPAGTVTLSSGTQSVSIHGTCTGPGSLTGETDKTVSVHGSCSGDITLTGETEKDITVTADLTDNTLNLTGGTAKTFLTGVDVNLSSLPITINLSQVTGGSISGNLTVSIPIAKKTVVTAVAVDGCNISETTEDIWVLSPTTTPSGDTGNLDVTVNASGLTFTPTTSNTTVSGNITSGSATVTPHTDTVTVPTTGTLYGELRSTGKYKVPNGGTFDGTYDASGTVKVPTGCTFDGNFKGTGTVNIPTGATFAGTLMTLNGEVNIPVSASFTGSQMSSTGTVSIPTTGTLNGGSITATGAVDVPTAGVISGLTISGAGSIRVPTTASFNSSAITTTNTTIRIPTEVDCETGGGV